jgi:hypothetical protein
MSWNILFGVVSWSAAEDADDQSPSNVFVQAAFVARRDPWQAAELYTAAPPDRGTPTLAGWTSDATVVIAGDPPAQIVVGDHETWGDLALKAMLNPEVLKGIHPLPWEASFTVPSSAQNRVSESAPELFSLEVDRYEATYDAELGILTSWHATRSDEIVQQIVLSNLHAVDL